jgi:hypothetical protein
MLEDADQASQLSKAVTPSDRGISNVAKWWVVLGQPEISPRSIRDRNAQYPELLRKW